MSTKNVLTIKDYNHDGGDLNLVIKSFLLQDRVKDSVRIVKLIVNRKPDKHSSRLGMFAYLHARDGYQNLGFQTVTLTVDNYADNGKFVARKIYDFGSVRVETSYMRGDDEELTFASNNFTEFGISQVEVFFD